MVGCVCVCLFAWSLSEAAASRASVCRDRADLYQEERKKDKKETRTTFLLPVVPFVVGKASFSGRKGQGGLSRGL